MVTNNDMVQISFSAKSIARQEKPRHMKYLNEFRTQQCRLFLEQQCQFHRPYTCFHWHFPNQKRRRPFKRPDGTFNYNPDVYCDKYDEATGSCTDGDLCPYAHRNAGDTERRYHPRYFKTGNCIYETTESGSCVKNGLHCAFAHGPDDIRLPVYDIREVQDVSSKFVVNLPASLEKERVLSEDPKWNEMFHVLTFYKTELCRKPPRMCRQGYSCPFYHNGKDKRRSPDKWRYRSTPCPAVRPNDEWQDSSLCESRDSCPYCHTRTEQQFHPEIYKSTKCNDVINSGYCPRGPFCAFAHSNCELTAGRDFLAKLQQERICPSNDHLLLQCSNTGCVSTTVTPLDSSHLRVFGNSVNSAVGATVGMQHPNTSSQYFLRSPSHPFPAFTTGDVALCDSNKRSAQRSAALIPNLMSTIGPVSSPPRSMLHTAVRGRRIDQCASPQQCIGTWQSPANSFSSDSPGHSTTTQATVVDNVPGYCPQELPSTSTVYSNGPINPHLPPGQYRQFQGNVLPNPFASDTHVREVARHRSGGSVSSEGAVSSVVHRDVHPLHFLNASSILGTSTYPGRSVDSILHGTPSTMLSTGIHQQQLFRSTPKKSRVSDATQVASVTVGTRSQQSRQKVSSSARTTTDPDTFGVTRSALLSEHSAAMNRGEIWHPAYGMSTPMDNRTSRPAWPWQPHVADSGANSEATVTEIDTCGLFEPGLTSLPNNVALPVSSSLLEESNRDSGLVPDFTSAGSGNFGDHFDASSYLGQLGAYCDSDQYAGRQLSSDPSFGPVGKSSYGSKQLLSDLSDECQTAYRQFFNSRFGVLSPAGLTGAEAGFHSPLDDILLNTSCGLDNTDQPAACGPVSVAPNASSSPIANIATSGPMAIPGRPGESDVLALSNHCALSEQLHQSHSPTRRLPQNTWPLVSNEISDTTNFSTDVSSPIRSQFSQSFSPVVGTPLLHTRQKPTFGLFNDAAVSPANIVYACSREVVVTSVVPSTVHFLEPSGKLVDVTSGVSPFQSTTAVTHSGVGSITTLPRAPTAVDFNNLPQSPILLSSPFSNPGSELERLSLQRELDEIRQRLGSKEDEVEALKKQRDFVTEHLRDSLGVIRQLFTSLNVSSSSSDLSKPLFVDTNTGLGSGSGTGCSAPLHVASDNSMDNCDEVENAETSFIDPRTQGIITSECQPVSNALCREKPALQQQQEALAALFSNPFVMALLNSEGFAAPSNAESPPTLRFHHSSPADEKLFVTQSQKPFTSLLQDLHQLQLNPSPQYQDSFDAAVSVAEASLTHSTAETSVCAEPSNTEPNNTDTT